MGLTKTDIFTSEQNKLASLLKAIAHPARIAIVEHIMKVNSCICGDLVNEIQLAQPTISQHLKELRNAEIIQGNIEGASVCYCINPVAIAALQDYFSSIQSGLKTQKSNCC
ncbi:MAG: metalloregulator ArsR/SmtB family transcription factor [Bacteroidetes bacterium]|nr:metalloregulator ArsR/SmtB family transcription factor [Bacteroidota bacterium]